MAFDLTTFGVGDEFEGSARELGVIISSILAAGGTFDYEGRSVVITSLPKAAATPGKVAEPKAPEVKEPEAPESKEPAVKEPAPKGAEPKVAEAPVVKKTEPAKTAPRPPK